MLFFLAGTHPWMLYTSAHKTASGYLAVHGYQLASGDSMVSKLDIGVREGEFFGMCCVHRYIVPMSFTNDTEHTYIYAWL